MTRQRLGDIRPPMWRIMECRAELAIQFPGPVQSHPAWLCAWAPGQDLRDGIVLCPDATSSRRCPAPPSRRHRRRSPSCWAWPSQRCSMCKGTPWTVACTPKPCLSPLGERCGASGRPASIMTFLTICQTRTRPSSQITCAAFFRERCASRMPCAVLSVSRNSAGTGTLRKKTLVLPEASLRFFRLRIAMLPPERSTRAGVISRSPEGRQPVQPFAQHMDARLG